jgi:hypothetical protein
MPDHAPVCSHVVHIAIILERGSVAPGMKRRNYAWPAMNYDGLPWPGRPQQPL